MSTKTPTFTADQFAAARARIPAVGHGTYVAGVTPTAPIAEVAALVASLEAKLLAARTHLGRMTDAAACNGCGYGCTGCIGINVDYIGI